MSEDCQRPEALSLDCAHGDAFGTDVECMSYPQEPPPGLSDVLREVARLLRPTVGDGGARANAGANVDLQFGSLRLAPRARTLLRDGRAVDIGGRAFDVLHVLLRSRGSVVTKAEIVDQVWPGLFVEESNLRFQVSCVRKALGVERDLIKTVPGRGYLLVADIGLSPREANDPAQLPVPMGSQELVVIPGGRVVSEDSGLAADGWHEFRGLLQSALDELRQLNSLAERSGAGSGPVADVSRGSRSPQDDVRTLMPAP
jgi:DNA-binding winged helix-turn-helix (wHTH) protein